MPTVLITTDFSAASRHALDYACLLLEGKDVMIDLLHIYPIPVTYTTDGVAIAAMGSAIVHAEYQLQEEVQEARYAYPDIKIAGRIIAGSFLETLQQQTRSSRPLFMILGTAGFTDLYLGDEDPLNALGMITVPVLFVPYGARLVPIKNIAYACNYAFMGPHIPIYAITDWVQFVGAGVHVIHSDPNPKAVDEKQSAGESWLQHQLESLKPAFHWVQDTDVIHGVTTFISQNEIDCVLVVPRNYGVWQNLFHKSRTKALARLNKIPVIAFHAKQ